jgi:hypothetical protein
MQWQFIITGLIVGSLVGLSGMGSGSLMTPILVLILGVRPTVAVGTDLVYASITKAAGAIAHLRQGQVRIRPALWLSAGSVPAAIAATALIGVLLGKQTKVADVFVSRFLGVTLLLAAALMLLQPLIRKRLWPQDPPPVLQPRLAALRRIRPLLLIVIGAVVGFLVGLTSVGAGSLVMVALLLLFPRWPMSRRVGTDVMQGCLLSAAAGAAHLTLGTVNLPIVGLLLLGSIPGVLLGSRLSKRVPEGILRPAVAGVLTLAAVQLL